ncbi:MAG TPA: LPXTG cell wall anchor domain-containing protein [Ilumatobacteraceae bacterium]|jgi:LPXTG-motif cell wall-anchored protein
MSVLGIAGVARAADPYPPTSDSVAQEAPVVPTEPVLTVPPVVNNPLPVTGSNSDAELYGGAVVLLTGAGLVVVARRRRASSAQA